MSIITGHTPLVIIFKKDVATLSQKQQRILLRIHQYRLRIIYKLGPDLFIADRTSRQNHSENKDEEISAMQLSINTIQMTNNIPVYDNTWTKNSNIPRPTPTVSQRVHNTRLAREQISNTTRPQNILGI